MVAHCITTVRVRGGLKLLLECELYNRGERPSLFLMPHDVLYDLERKGRARRTLDRKCRVVWTLTREERRELKAEERDERPDEY